MTTSLSKSRCGFRSFDLGYECCYCGKIDDPSIIRMDLHEIVISRGNTRYAGDEALLAIMDRRNCGWVHQYKCHVFAEGGAGRKAAIRYLIRYEGYLSVMRFVFEMREHLASWREYAWDVNKVYVATMERMG